MTNYEPFERTGPDLSVIADELIDEHYPFDCNLIEIDPHTWAIHGSIPVGGEVILAEFGNQDDAKAALDLLWAAEANRRAAGATGVFPGLDRSRQLRS